MSTKELHYRNEMNPEFLWNLNDMIQDSESWTNLFEHIKDSISQFKAFEGKLLESADQLFNALSLRDSLSIDFTKIYVYSNMLLHQDTDHTKSQELVQKVASLEVLISSETAFFEPEIMEADESILIHYLKKHEGLSLYEHYFNNMIRQKSHILSKEQEELLALAGDFADSPQSIFSMLMNADLVLPEILDEAGETIRLTQGNYLSYLKSSHREVRKAAFEAMASVLQKNKNTLSSIYLSSLKKDVFLARARKFTSSCEASLDTKNIQVAVYDQLVGTVNNHLHLMHRYVKLRKEMLGLDELHLYDLYTPMVKDMDEVIPFETAKEIVLHSLAPLGEEYTSFIKKGFESHWIDVYENKGKRSGAYSWGTYDVHPYVLLNYQENLNNTFTLAHEMGHALHSYYSNATQPFIYHSYPIFLAEVASTVNESLLIHHLLATTTDREKRKYLINHYMESFRTTLYRQVMFAEFEKKAHEIVEKGEPVTPAALNALHFDLNKKYYGEDIVIDESIQYEWSRIPHFYNAFYVYQYATGFSSAVTLSKMILEEGAPAVEKYINFLKSGSSRYPLETLKLAGVDMTTTAPIEKALSVFEQLLEEMESYNQLND
jgi:oligoendopeptidase F